MTSSSFDQSDWRGEFRLNLLAAALPGAIYDWDIKTGKVVRSVGLYELIGYYPEEVPTDAAWWRERIHPDDVGRLMPSKTQGASGEVIRSSNQYRVRHRAGHYVWVWDSCAFVFGDDGQIERMMGCTLNIDAQKKAEAELKASESIARQRLDEIEAIYQSVPIGLCVLDDQLRFVRINERLAEINGYSIEAHIGRTPMELLPDLAQDAEATLRRVLETGESIYNLELRGQTPAQPGRERIWMEHWIPIRDSADRVIGINIVAEEVTEQIRDEEFASALFNLARALAAAKTLDEVADQIVQQGILTLGAGAGALALLDDDGDTLRVIRTPGYDPNVAAYWREFSLADSTTPIARAIKERRPILIGSVAERQADYPSPADAPQVNAPYTTFAALPMITEDQLLGGIGFSFAKSQPFDERQVNFLTTLASQCAQALERALLTESAHELAALEERQRLARDLHDAVSQTLFSATMIAEAIPRQFQRDPARALELTSQLTTLSRAALAEMRTLLFELRPEGLLKTQLGELLGHLVATARGHKEIAAELYINGEDRILPGNAHVALFRIAQEAVNNILKHSGASAFAITLDISESDVDMMIRDDGVGFEVAARMGGFGLGSMRERAASVGAVLDIQSTPNGGTTLFVDWHNPMV